MSILDDVKSTIIHQLIVGVAIGAVCAMHRRKYRRRALQRTASLAIAPPEPKVVIDPVVAEEPTVPEPVKSEAHEFTSDPNPATFKLLTPTSTHLTMSVDSESTATVKVATTAGPKKVGRRNKRPARLVLVDPSDLDEMPVREQMRSSRRIER